MSKQYEFVKAEQRSPEWFALRADGITATDVSVIAGLNPYIDHWFGALSKLLPDYEINTPKRIAAFIAQCSHESGGFTALKENLNYKPATLRKLFAKYFPTDALAEEYCASDCVSAIKCGTTGSNSY